MSRSAAALAELLPAILAANDNDGDEGATALSRAVLRLVGLHGLGAARHAAAQAEIAYFAGERARFRWWLQVTRTLDRILADEFRDACAERVLPRR
jgi:hypothetical protein